jgi:type I restriction enzyme R subunit
MVRPACFRHRRNDASQCRIPRGRIFRRRQRAGGRDQGQAHLDRQLQNTIAQFEQTPGVVRKIDGTSRQLKAAIEGQAKIIITTIQKFSTEHLRVISGQGTRRFAVLIDEAHGSQSGKGAQALSDALSRDGEIGTPDEIEDLIAEYQRQRGPQANISYFAFTATPRNVTLERFGTGGSDGLPHPFHLYSMRQAIEEGSDIRLP